MSNLKIQRQHHMNHDDVKTRVGALADKLVERLGGHYHWEGDKVYYAYEGGVKACVACGESDVQVDVELAMMMSFLKGRVKDEIESYLDQHFS